MDNIELVVDALTAELDQIRVNTVRLTVRGAACSAALAELMLPLVTHFSSTHF